MGHGQATVWLVSDDPAKPPTVADLLAPVRAAEAEARERRRALILDALSRANGNRTEAAKLAGYSSPRALRTAASKLGIDLERDAPPPPPPEVTGRSQRTPRDQFKPRTKRAAKRARARKGAK